MTEANKIRRLVCAITARSLLHYRLYGPLVKSRSLLSIQLTFVKQLF